MNKTNNRWMLFVALAAVALVMAGRNARAGAIAGCPTGVPLSAVLGTTCTIGDKTFDFTTPIPGSTSAFEAGAVGTGAAPTSDELKFVTGSDDGSPGFKLSAEPGFALSVTSLNTDAQDAMDFVLLYSASITKPSSPRAPRCRLLSQPLRRPLPHSAARITRSSVRARFTLIQLCPREPAA